MSHQLAQMIDVLRRSLGEPGKLEHEAGARIWSATSRRIYFSLVEHAGRTTLRLEEHMSPEAHAAVGREEQLRRAFVEIVRLAVTSRKALPGATTS